MANWIHDLCKEYEIESIDELNYFDLGPEWVEVSEEIVGESKYNNVKELVYENQRTGKFLRFSEHSLPYGIEDYEMDPDVEGPVEVFPRQVTVTQFLSQDEINAQ